MILLDTNIIIDYWKNVSNVITKAVDENEIAICGLIYTELLHGAKNKDDSKRIIDSLSSFKYFEFKEYYWEKLADILKVLKTNGIVVPFQDAILTCIAIENNIPLYTNDKHFKLIKSVINDLILFTP